MRTTRARRLRRAALFAASAVSVAATVLVAGVGGAVASPASGGANPIVRSDGGFVRGVDVVVTINYRLGALGFLAHPALAERDMAKRAGSEITASHAVPATHPGDVAAVIVRAVRAVT